VTLAEFVELFPGVNQEQVRLVLAHTSPGARLQQQPKCASCSTKGPV
jgi:hypothetical protein